MVPHDPVDVTLVQFLGVWDIMHHPSEDGKVVFCVEVGAFAGYKGEAGELLPLQKQLCCTQTFYVLLFVWQQIKSSSLEKNPWRTGL